MQCSSISNNECIKSIPATSSWQLAGSWQHKQLSQVTGGHTSARRPAFSHERGKRLPLDDVRSTSSLLPSARIIIAGDQKELNCMQGHNVRNDCIIWHSTLISSTSFSLHERNDISPQIRRPSLRFLPSPSDGIKLPEPAKLTSRPCLSHTTAYVASNSTRNSNALSMQCPVLSAIHGRRWWR